MTPTFTLALNYNTKTFVLTDTTTYTGYSLPTLTGWIVATGPNGIFHAGSFAAPDVLPSDVPPVSAAIALPLETDGSGYVAVGDYSYTYYVKAATATLQRSIVAVNGTTYAISGDWTAAFAGGSTFAIYTSGSVLVVGGITPTDVTYINGQTTFTYTGTAAIVTNFIQFNTTFTASTTTELDIDWTYPAGCIEVEADYDCNILTITDATNYPDDVTSNSRLFTVRYPQNNGTAVHANVTSGLATVEITPMWTQTWTINLTNTITAVVDGVTITYTVTAQKSYKVIDPADICSAYECMENLYNKYNSLKSYATVQASILQAKLIQATLAFNMFQMAKRCEPDEACDWLVKLGQICDSCGCGCTTCADEVSVQVIGICENAIITADGSIVFQSSGNGITITPNTVGTTTTYTFTITQATIIALIQSTIQTTVNMTDLLDVTTTGLANTTVPYYNGTQFIFKIFSLANLIDADMTIAPTTGQLLKWNGTDWVPHTLLFANVTDVIQTAVATKDILVKGPTGDQWINKDVRSWTAFSTSIFSGSWGNAGAIPNFYPLAYRVNYHAGTITIRGTITHGSSVSANTAMFTLPSAQRPTSDLYFTAIAGTGLGGTEYPVPCFISASTGVVTVVYRTVAALAIPSPINIPYIEFDVA